MLQATILIAGACTNGAQAGLNALAATIYPTPLRATGTGWALGVGRIGAILGPLAGGGLIAAGFAPPACSPWLRRRSWSRPWRWSCSPVAIAES